LLKGALSSEIFIKVFSIIPDSSTIWLLWRCTFYVQVNDSVFS
jgi:hypothetical protein